MPHMLMTMIGYLAGTLTTISFVPQLFKTWQCRSAREISYALSRRMGLTRRAHAVSVTLELGGMLLIAWLLGVFLAGVAARILYLKLDPLPDFPPPASGGRCRQASRGSAAAPASSNAAVRSDEPSSTTTSWRRSAG